MKEPRELNERNHQKKREPLGVKIKNTFFGTLRRLEQVDFKTDQDLRRISLTDGLIPITDSIRQYYLNTYRTETRSLNPPPGRFLEQQESALTLCSARHA